MLVSVREGWGVHHRPAHRCAPCLYVCIGRGGRGDSPCRLHCVSRGPPQLYLADTRASPFILANTFAAATTGHRWDHGQDLRMVRGRDLCGWLCHWLCPNPSRDPEPPPTLVLQVRQRVGLLGSPDRCRGYGGGSSALKGGGNGGSVSITGLWVLGLGAHDGRRELQRGQRG